MNRKFRAIVQSNLEPDDKQVIWLNEDYLRYYNNGEWVPLGRNKEDPIIMELLLNRHISNKQNPHSVTKEQIGLSNVTNDIQLKESDAGKPNGIATLDSTGKVPLGQLPDNIGNQDKLELGETSTTAYPGDKGKKNANAISSLTNALDSVDTYSRATRNQLDAFKNTKGQALGIVPLDENGKVASSYLPSYVDDVLEYDNRTAFPTTGESGKIYIALDTNKTYRWGGTTYVELTSSITLGETSSTAYAGDKGKKNREDINNLRDSFDSLANHVDEVNNKTNTNTTAIEELTTEVDSTNTEVNTINGKISKLNTTIGDVRSSFNNYASAKTPIIDKVEPHIANKQNPHEVTKAQVGLSNVTNDAQVKRSEMGANDGVATLDDNGKIPESQLPSGVTSSLVLGETAGTAYEGSKGANHEAAFTKFNNFLIPDFNTGTTTNNNGVELRSRRLSYNNGSLTSKGNVLILRIYIADPTKTSGCGLLLNTDKKKLDSIETGANKYVLPEAGNNTLGGIKAAPGTAGQAVGTINNKYINEKAVYGNFSYHTGMEKVLPTYYQVLEATTEKYGLMSPEDKVKLDSLSSGGSSTITEYTEAEITALLKQIRF